MTSAVPEPPAVDAHADARFAAYLADIAAHVDDPEGGEEYRAILDDDPQTQRELFDLAEALAANPLQPSPSPLVWAAAAVLVLTVLVFVVVRLAC